MMEDVCRASLTCCFCVPLFFSCWCELRSSFVDLSLVSDHLGWQACLILPAICHAHTREAAEEARPHPGKKNHIFVYRFVPLLLWIDFSGTRSYARKVCVASGLHDVGGYMLIAVSYLTCVGQSRNIGCVIVRLTEN